MTTKGFNIQLRQDDRKQLIVTNTLQSNCVTFTIKGAAALNYGFNGDTETLTSDLTLSYEDFVRFVNALESAKNKVLELMPEPQPKTMLIVDKTIDEEMTKQEQLEKKTTTKPKTTKKGGKK